MILSEFISQLSLKDYIRMFGTVWNGTETVPFELWPKQMELCDILEQYKIVLTPKPRQVGISEVAAERALKTLFSGKKKEGVVISKSEDFAIYFLEKRILPKYENLLKHPQIKWPTIVSKTKSEIKFSNGSSIKSLTSSQSSAASMSLDFIVFDEAGGIDENYGNFRQLYANAKPAMAQRPNSWAMIIGTSVPGSYYNEMVHKSVHDDDYPIPNFFMPYDTDPSRTPEWWAEQKADIEDDVYLQYPRDINDFFHVREGLIFKNFDPEEGGAHVKKFNIEDLHNCRFSIGYDHGSRHPAVCLFFYYDQYRDHLYVCDELFYKKDHQTDVTNIAKDIKRKLYPYPKPPSERLADTAIFNNIGVVTVAEMFRRNGISFQKVRKFDETGSRQLLSERFTHNSITIHPQCYNTIEQLRSYRWNPNRKGEEPEDKNDDAIDVLRYRQPGLRTQKRPSPRAIIQPYSEESQRARASYTNNNMLEVSSWQAL